MPEVKVEIKVWCCCGKELCSQSWAHNGGILVEPCVYCLNRERDEGYDEGYSKGYDLGFKEGKELIDKGGKLNA